MKLKSALEVPDGAVDKGAEAELIRSVKEQTALKLYCDERVTTGEAAEMLGLNRIQFLDLLRHTGLGFQVELDDEDFAQIGLGARIAHGTAAGECGRPRQ